MIEILFNRFSKEKFGYLEITINNFFFKQKTNMIYSKIYD